MKIGIDRPNFGIAAVLAVSVALICSQTVTSMHAQRVSTDRVLTLIVPEQHRQAPLMTDPDVGSSSDDQSNAQADNGLCLGKTPNCDNNDEDDDNSEDDDSYDPPEPTDPIPA